MGLGNLNSNNWFTPDFVFNDNKTSREIIHHHFMLQLLVKHSNKEGTYQSTAHTIFKQ